MHLSIRLKLIIPLVAGLVFIAVATAVLLRFVHERSVDAAALRETERAAEALDSQEEAELDRLSALAGAIMSDEALAQALQARDRAALLARAEPLFRELRDVHGVTHWYFHDADPARGVVLRVHRPDLFGDVTQRPSFLRAVETGREATGREFGQTAYAVRVVRPWREGGQIIGYLELATDVHTFLARLKRLTGDDYGMVLDKRLLDQGAWSRLPGQPERWEARREVLAVARTDGSGQVFGRLERMAEVPAHPTVVGRSREGGRTFAHGLFPLRADGALVGAVAVMHEITPLLTGMDELRLQIVVLVVLLAAALAALVIFLLETLVFERVDRMSKVLEHLPERLARGDWDLGDGRQHSDDEIGRVEGFLDKAIAAVGSFVTDVRRASPPKGMAGRRPEGDRY